jgi:hypothetical protein
VFQRLQFRNATSASDSGSYSFNEKIYPAEEEHVTAAERRDRAMHRALQKQKCIVGRFSNNNKRLINVNVK